MAGNNLSRMAPAPDKYDPLVIFLSGSVAVGKTSLVHNLARLLQNDGFKVMRLSEPTEKWCNVGGTDILGNLYRSSRDPTADPSAARLRMQMLACCTLSSQLNMVEPNTIHIAERTQSESKDCFFEALKQRMTPTDRELMYHMHTVVADNSLPVTFQIGLYCTTNVCWTRLRHRGRPQEKSLTFEYSKLLNEKYFQYFLQQTRKNKALLMIDASQPEIEIAKQAYEYVTERVLCTPELKRQFMYSVQ